MKLPEIFIGFDTRQPAAFAVTRHSVERHAPGNVSVRGLVLADLRLKGLYRRPTGWHTAENGKPVLWDRISDAPMSTEFACSRFLVPLMSKAPWAMFMDGDMLARAPLAELFDSLDPKYALYCVKHRHEPPEGVKMDGQMQVRYARKNWSSLMVFNTLHPANNGLTFEMVNELPGRDLHRFCWLHDAHIGELGPEWNFLVGHSDKSIEPKIVHFTEGCPDIEGYEDQPFADEWRATLWGWAAQDSGRADGGRRYA